jgi:hypothetical protein
MFLMLVGPLLAVSMVALAFLSNSGPGFLFFSLAAVGGFAVCAPLLQVALRQTRRFANRPGAACAVALGSVVLGLLIASRASVFNQW